jgi:hypothetical protein
MIFTVGRTYFPHAMTVVFREVLVVNAAVGDTRKIDKFSWENQVMLRLRSPKERGRDEILHVIINLIEQATHDQG